MAPLIDRLAPQPLIALCTGAGALLLTVQSWEQAGSPVRPEAGAMAVLLFFALSLSYKYPIHIQRGTKICMGTVPLYLLAVLVPPQLAAIVAGAGVMAGNWSVRSQRGLFVSDMLTDATCWASIVLVGSAAGRIFLGAGGVGPHLVLTGVVLWTGQVLASPLLFYPITRQAPHRIIALFVRETGLTEGCQYVVGLLGALAAVQYGWAVALLLVPLIPLHRAFKSSKETQESTRLVLESMADAVDLRDPYTGGHSRRVAQYSATILESMGVSGPEADLVVISARIHDIGKIGIPDGVLLKDGALTPEERTLMEMHPDAGARLLERYPDFSRGVEILRHHHERWDGQGYPQRLRGTEIPFGARVVAVADSFDAMTSDRPYRKGMPQAKALAILQEGRGRQWEASVVDAFVRAMTELPEERTTSAPDRVAGLAGGVI